MEALLLSIEAAAQMLGLSAWTVRGMCRDGRIASLKLSRRRMIRRAEVERLAAQGIARPPADKPRQRAKAKDEGCATQK